MGPQEMLDRAEVKNKWQLTPLKDFKSPRLTERMWRTAVVVLLTSLIYEYLIPGGRNPCFALIGAVYGVGSRFEEGFHNGINRLIGTFVGGILVIPFYMLYQNSRLESWLFCAGGRALPGIVVQSGTAGGLCDPAGNRGPTLWYFTQLVRNELFSIRLPGFWIPASAY